MPPTNKDIEAINYIIIGLLSLLIIIILLFIYFFIALSKNTFRIFTTVNPIPLTDKNIQYIYFFLNISLFIIYFSCIFLDITSYYTIYTKDTPHWNEQRKIGTIVCLSIITVVWYLFMAYKFHWSKEDDGYNYLKGKTLNKVFLMITLLLTWSLTIFTISYFCYIFKFKRSGSNLKTSEKVIFGLNIVLDVLVIIFISNCLAYYGGYTKLKQFVGPKITAYIEYFESYLGYVPRTSDQILDEILPSVLRIGE